MAAQPQWRPFPVAVPGIPNLLVSAVFSSSESYNVRITDLANVWSESLDRRAIVRRGVVEETSIDPTDGPDQLRRMLELLGAAFDTTDPEHPTTSLVLSSVGDELEINVTCILPQPLKPFRWPMRLHKGTQSALATDLVLPLIQAQEARLREIDHLMSSLKDKDAVINKLLDKLEAMGTGLEYVFNSLSGRRKISREAAAAKVKGLAPFCEQDFRTNPTSIGPLDVPSLLGRVFGAAAPSHRSDLELQASTDLDGWWKDLGNGKPVALVDRSKPRHGKEATPPPPPPVGQSKHDDDDDDDDDFQVQATPPGARKRTTATRPVLAAADDDDETSDGEDGSDARSPPPPAANNKPPGARLGALGGRHQRPSPTPPPPPPPPSARRLTPLSQHADDDDEPETASEDDEMDDTPPPPPPASSAPPPPRRGGLGRIGGRAPPPAPEPAEIQSPPVADKDEAPAPSSQPRGGHRLGAIGRRVQVDDPVSDDDTPGRSRGRRSTVASAGASPPKPAPKRETSQERADRKRVELQQELARRAAAGPAKKKRKF